MTRPSKSIPIVVNKAEEPVLLEQAFAVRREVFVLEQKVSMEDEFDEFEDESIHFLALAAGKACGAARWRATAGGLKLERFAVLEAYRGMGVGSALVEAVMHDIDASGRQGKRYLHAQLDAAPLYAKYGFKPVGEIFSECDILHQAMEISS